MSKKKFDESNEDNRKLANAIATGVDADKTLEAYFCRAIFLMGPKKPDELKFLFADDKDYKGDMDHLEERFNALQERGILQLMDGDGRVTISQDMMKLILTINPGSVTDEDRKEDPNHGDSKTAKTHDDKSNQESSHQRSLNAEVEKIRSPENLELAKKLADSKVGKDDDEVRLVRAVYDEAAEGVSFDTINEKFDASTTRAQLFMSLSKELRKRGVIEKLDQENGDLYVVTMPFRSLMEEAARTAKDEGRFESAGAEVAKAPHVSLKEQGQKADGDFPIRTEDHVRNDESPRNELTHHQRGFQSSTPHASRGMMYAGRGNESGGDNRDETHDTARREKDQARQGQDTRQREDTALRSVHLPQGKGRDRIAEEDTRIKPGYYPETDAPGRKEIQPDAGVMSLTILVFGTPVHLDEVLRLYTASLNLLELAENNPDIEPTFTAFGIPFNVDRARTFMEHAEHYGFVR